jgi:hypothetical protein
MPDRRNTTRPAPNTSTNEINGRRSASVDDEPKETILTTIHTIHTIITELLWIDRPDTVGQLSATSKTSQKRTHHRPATRCVGPLLIESEVYLVQGERDRTQTQKSVSIILWRAPETEGDFHIVNKCTQEALH